MIALDQVSTTRNRETEHQPILVCNSAATPDLYDLCCSFIGTLLGVILCMVFLATVLRFITRDQYIDPIYTKFTCFGCNSSYNPVDRSDCALNYGGAQILPSPTSCLGRSYMGARVDSANYRGLEKAVMESTYVRECWAMEDSYGRIAIVLITPITVTNINIDHLHCITLNITTATREIDFRGIMKIMSFAVTAPGLNRKHFGRRAPMTTELHTKYQLKGNL